MTDLRRTFQLHVEAFRETYGMPTAAALLVDVAVLAASIYAWASATGALRWLGGVAALFIMAHRLWWAIREVRR